MDEDRNDAKRSGNGDFTALLQISGFWLFLLGVGLFVFGGMTIDFRIVTTGMAAAAVAVLAFLAEKIRALSPKNAQRARGWVIPVAVAFWLVVTLYGIFIAPRGVIPTREYDEWFPRSADWSRTHREANLVEAPAFRMEGETPTIDGATSFFDLYGSFYTAIRANDSRYMYRNKTPEAYANLSSGAADLIVVFRPSEQQEAAARARGREFVITPIGYDAFVFFVNKANPVDNLTIRQVKDIYSGKIRNWKEVGGADEAITPFQRYAGSGSQSRMERFMAGETLMEADQEYRFPHMMGIVKAAARYRNRHSAIGYSFYLYVDTMLSGGGVKLLSIDGVAPSLETIGDRSYPLIDDICVVTAGTDNPNVPPFIEWILSPQGQAIVEACGYTPVAPAKPGAAVTQWH